MRHRSCGVMVGVWILIFAGVELLVRWRCVDLDKVDRAFQADCFLE